MTKVPGMSSTTIPVVRLAGDIAKVAGLSDEALALLQPNMVAHVYFEHLLQHEQFRDGVRFLASGLSKRGAVWWGCLCAWEIAPDELPPAEEAALGAAAKWVTEPTEPNRRAAGVAADAAGAKNSAGQLALAAFGTSGSIAPAGKPDVPPPPTMTAKMVGNAVIMAANLADETEKQYRQFLLMGVQVAQGKNRWH